MPPGDRAERARGNPARRNPCRDRRADNQGEARPHVRPDTIECHRRALAAIGEIIADQGIGRRRHRRFADADADAAEQELDIASREPAPRGHRAPKRDTRRQEARARARVDKATDRQAADRQEQRERQALEQTDLDIAEMEIALYRGHQQVQHLAIDERQYIGRDEDAQGVPGISSPRGWCLSCHLRCPASDRPVPDRVPADRAGNAG